MKKLLFSMFRGFTLSTFKSIFRTMMLLVLIPVCVAVLIAVNSLSIIQEEIKNSGEVIFEEIKDEIDQNFNFALSLSNRIRKDSLIVDYSKEKKRDYYKEYEILTELDDLISGYEQVELAYVYFPQFDIVISNMQGAKTEYFHSLYYSSNYSKWLEQLQIKQNISVDSMKGITYGESSAIISKVLHIRTASPQAVVVLQLKKSFFSDILKRLRLKSSDQILVFFKDNCICSTWSDETDAKFLNVIKENTLNKRESSINNINYKIQTLISSKYGLSFIYLTPNSVLYNSIQYAKMYAVLALAFCLCITLFLCFLFSKRMDFSFHQVKNQNDQLILIIKQYSDELKEAYLEKIMQGHVASVQGIREGCRLYEIDVESNWFGLILICIDNDERAKYDELAREPFKATKDLLKRLILKSRDIFKNVVVIRQEEQYFCFVSGNAEHIFLYQKELQKCVEQIQISLKEEEHLTCKAYISNPFMEIQNLQEAYEIVLKLQRKSEDDDENGESEKCSVDKVLSIIKKRITDSNFSVADIAGELEVTTSYLSRYFKKQTGMGMLEYIHQNRIALSKDIMMKNKDIKIKKIAEMTGFYSDAVFIRVFKKSEGITPGQYREYLEGQK